MKSVLQVISIKGNSASDYPCCYIELSDRKVPVNLS